MPKQLRAVVRLALRPLPLAIGLLGANCALAEEGANPYYFGVSQAFTHDDNIYRRSDNGTLPIVADTVSSTGLLGGIDQPFGRQRFYANGNINTNRHKNQEQLNNTSYGLSAGLDWSTIERLSGNVRLSANQSLANYGDVNASTTTAKNMQKSQQFGFNARYGIAASLGLEGGIDHNSLEYSAADDLRTVKQDGANLGLRWGHGGPMSVAVSGHASTAKYPQVQVTSLPTPTFAADEVKRRDLQVSVTYSPSGVSSFTSHLSATHENHTLDNLPDFSGVTGGVSWDYNLSGKLKFNASLTRDTGTATTFLQLAPIPTVPVPAPVQTIRVESNRLSTAAMLAFNYEATAKIQLNGNFRHVSSSDSGISGQALSSYGLGVKYQPTRTISLGCNANRESRSSVYSDNIVSCRGELAFR